MSNLYKKSFLKEKTLFNIKSMAKAFSFNGNNNLLYHILTHSFYNYEIKINYPKENEYKPTIDNFVIHGAFDLKDTNLYKCPYITFSIEPFRPYVFNQLTEINNLPILELTNAAHLFKIASALIISFGIF